MAYDSVCYLYIYSKVIDKIEFGWLITGLSIHWYGNLYNGLMASIMEIKFKVLTCSKNKGQATCFSLF